MVRRNSVPFIHGIRYKPFFAPSDDPPVPFNAPDNDEETPVPKSSDYGCSGLDMANNASGLHLPATYCATPEDSDPIHYATLSSPQISLQITWTMSSIRRKSCMVRDGLSDKNVPLSSKN
eukprot:586868-Hanusia_phi.AAC.2